jgi:hypothetical protein
MTDVVPYPPAFPSVSGQNLTISAFLANPLVLRDTIRDLTVERFIMDRIYAQGQRPGGGTVLFNQVTASTLYTVDDAQAIRPGAAFPKTKHTEQNPSVATITKYGLEEEITREDILRNNWPVLRDALVRIANTVVKKVNTEALAALDAAPLQSLVGVDFTTATVAQIVNVFVSAVSLIEDADMGYDGIQINAFFNPTQANELMGNIDLLKLLQAEGPDMPARTGNFGTLMRVRSFKTNRIAASTARFVAEGIVGSWHQEEGDGVLTRTYTIDEKGPEDQAVQGWRPITFAVRHPKAAVNVTGI